MRLGYICHQSCVFVVFLRRMASKPTGASMDVKLHKSGALMRWGTNGATIKDRMIPQLNIWGREISYWVSRDIMESWLGQDLRWANIITFNHLHRASIQWRWNYASVLNVELRSMIRRALEGIWSIMAVAGLSPLRGHSGGNYQGLDLGMYLGYWEQRRALGWIERAFNLSWSGWLLE